MTPISRETFLQFKPATQQVTIPDQGTVTVRELRASEMLEFHKRNSSGNDAVGYLVATAAEDATGNPLFTSADIPALSKLPNSKSDPIVAAALALSQPPVTPEGKSTPAAT